MNRLLLAPALLLGLAFAACGGPEVDHESIEISNVEAPNGGTATSSTTSTLWDYYDELLDGVWDMVCDQWELIEQTGVYVFCENYLDAQGIPSSGIRRIIARRICHRKVNQAIDEAVCSIQEFFEDAGVDEPSDDDAGEGEEGASAGEPDGGI